MRQYELTEQYKSFEFISTKDWCEDFLREWLDFKSKFQDGDEIFSFCYHDPNFSWGYAGAGYCIVRNQTIISEILTLIA